MVNKEELMYGNFLVHTCLGMNKEIVTVKEVLENGINLEWCEGELEPKYYFYNLQPIDLTKEILLENGFFKYEDEKDSYYIQGEDLPFRKYVVNLHEHTFNVEYTEYVTDNKVLIKICDTNFVHELQNALSIAKVGKTITNIQ